jgi:uncharacterized membrane protein YozB (DUF420 family)
VDPKLVFWSVALVDLATVVLCTGAGVRAIRRKDVRRHKRWMLTAGALILGFLVAYVGKVATLGKEDRSAWTAQDYNVLYAHETCIAVMLLAGGYALFRAWRFRGRLGPKLVLPPESDPLAGRLHHRRAGWVAVVSGVLAFVTAMGVWGGMFARAS